MLPSECTEYLLSRYAACLTNQGMIGCVVLRCMPQLVSSCSLSVRICPISVRWNLSRLPCACDVYAGACLTAMLPTAVAVILSNAFRKSWSDCITVLFSVACVLPHSITNFCKQVDKYCM